MLHPTGAVVYDGSSLTVRSPLFFGLKIVRDKLIMIFFIHFLAV